LAVSTLVIKTVWQLSGTSTGSTRLVPGVVVIPVLSIDEKFVAISNMPKIQGMNPQGHHYQAGFETTK
jgi:hypothetical protein